MSAKFTVSGGNTTFKQDWTLPNAKMISKFNDLARKYFKYGFGNHGTEEEPKVFDDLSNQEKADVVYEYTDDMYRNDSNDERKARHDEISKVNFEAEEAHE